MLRTLGVVLVLTSALLSITSATIYDGYKVYNVIPQTRAQCDLLAELSQQRDVYDFFHLSKFPQHPAQVMVAPAEEVHFVNFLNENNFEFSIFNDNVGEALRREFVTKRTTRMSGTGQLSNERYYTHDEINEYIDDLAARYPSRVYVETVGKSYEGRLMKTITITNGNNKVAKNIIFMDGGMHAREWISPAGVLYVIHQLVENYAENAALLLNYDWVILPCANPDGYQHSQSSATSRLWRKTRQPHSDESGQICMGADPNRNFDFHWNEEGASSNPCSDIFAGPTAFSEPETTAVRDLLHRYYGRGIMYLTLHSYGNYLLYPWGWTSDLPENWQDLDEVAQAGGNAIFNATGTTYTVGSSTNVLYIAAGASDDYAYYAGFPISITMELPRGGMFGFNPPATSIDYMVKETWIGIRAMAEKIIEKYP